jgi:hypothetical protein
MLYTRMMVELKNIYLTVVSSYTYKFHWKHKRNNFFNRNKKNNINYQCKNKDRKSN